MPGAKMEILVKISDKEIASILAITERTVKFHVSNILSKLGLERRTELVRWHEPI
jgi:DNA-binding NarL/FixJ family response regulator